MPTLSGPPPRLAAPRLLQALQTGHAMRWARTGQPTVVLPLGVRDDGLPDSVQLVGESGAEPLLLAVATRLELLGRRRHAPGWPRPAAGPRWDLATGGRHRATIGA
jgi:amidase